MNELKTYEGNSGSVTAFAIEPSTGELRESNIVNSRGAGPAHMSVDATGNFAFVANYIDGSIAVLPILADGRLDQACFVHQDSGAVGPKQAASGPPGSFAISGHDAPHAHMIQADPQNPFLLYADLGQDRIYMSKLEPSGKLTPSATPFVSLPAGDGPRHFALHPNGRSSTPSRKKPPPWRFSSATRRWGAFTIGRQSPRSRRASRVRTSVPRLWWRRTDAF